MRRPKPRSRCILVVGILKSVCCLLFYKFKCFKRRNGIGLAFLNAFDFFWSRNHLRYARPGASWTDLKAGHDKKLNGQARNEQPKNHHKVCKPSTCSEPF